MPLSFSYGKYDVKKEEFPLVLYDLRESLGKWASHYTLDIDLSVKKPKDLAKIHNLFPIDSPIYYVKGKYRSEHLSNTALQDLIRRRNRVRLFMTFKGKDCPDYTVALKLWKPHFRGFPYYKPDEDNHTMSEISISPLTSITIQKRGVTAGFLAPATNSATDPRRWSEIDNRKLRKAIYDRVSTRLPIPSFDEFMRDDKFISDESDLEINTGHGFKQDLIFKGLKEHEGDLLAIFDICIDFAERPLEAWGEIIGTREDMDDFLRDKYTRKALKIEQCGFNTTATGSMGVFDNIDFDFLKNVLTEVGKPHTVKLRWESIKCAANNQYDFDCFASIIVEGRRLQHSLEFLLHCDEADSELHRKFIVDMKNLTGLPFDKPRLWSVAAYAGPRYQDVIEQIKDFYLKATDICDNIGKQYRSSAAYTGLDVKSYYDSEPGLFVKSDIRFNATIKTAMRERMPHFQYDPHTSLPIIGLVSFVQNDHRGLYTYISFSGDPHWRSKIFVVAFEISRYPIRGGISGPWWRYSRNSRDFIGADLWWHYETMDELIRALGNAFGFIEDVGGHFFREIGSLLLGFDKNSAAPRIG